MTSRSQLFSAGGYPLDELTSALQKDIRRGNIEQAVFWAQELESRFWKYLWKRLQTISHEDIGPANPQAAMYTYTMWQQYQEARDNGNVDLCAFIVINTVTALCISKKCRTADHLIWLIYCNPDAKFEIPDYALDKHTERGRKKGRTIQHFMEVGAQISPANEALDSLFKERAYALHAHLKDRPWWAEFKKKGPSKKKDVQPEIAEEPAEQPPLL